MYHKAVQVLIKTISGRFGVPIIVVGLFVAPYVLAGYATALRYLVDDRGHRRTGADIVAESIPPSVPDRLINDQIEAELRPVIDRIAQRMSCIPRYSSPVPREARTGSIRMSYSP
jgi:hypothetical protein